VPKLLAMLRNPYALIAQGFLFGGLVVLATQDSREAVAAPAPAAISSPDR
jgi:hypothetical protein